MSLLKVDYGEVGGGIDNYYARVKLKTNIANAAVLPTFGMTKLDISNAVSNSSAYVKCANINDWSTFTLVDETTVLATLEGVSSQNAIDISGYDVVTIGCNNRSSDPLCSLHLYN